MQYYKLKAIETFGCLEDIGCLNVFVQLYYV